MIGFRTEAKGGHVAPLSTGERTCLCGISTLAWRPRGEAYRRLPAIGEAEGNWWEFESDGCTRRYLRVSLTVSSRTAPQSAKARGGKGVVWCDGSDGPVV